jgi:sirohydrochlorin ferrochelatase
MRPARIGVPLVAVAHGSRDPRAAATVTELLAMVRARAAARGLRGVDVREAFLDHCVPSLPAVLSALRADGSGRAVLVPLLLTAAYHSTRDIPAQVAAASARLPGLLVRQAAALGPHPLLGKALDRRLREALPPGMGTGTAGISVVLAAAGSSDPRANATIAAVAARWQASGRWRRVVPAYASAASPAPAPAVRALRDEADGPVVVASYLLSPGYFADRIRDQAMEAGAAAVSAPLGAAPEVADVIVERYRLAPQADDGLVLAGHRYKTAFPGH